MNDSSNNREFPPLFTRWFRFLACAIAILVSPAVALGQAQNAGGQTLYNGIVLPQQWPPLRTPTQAYQVPPYITNPPAVIPTDLGRQLFVDDFLIQQTTMTRTQHQPVMYPANPILSPNQWDTGNAFPYSDGVWFDPADRLFKMWFFCADSNMICYAYSLDGTNWIRPAIPDAVVPNTDEVLEIAIGRDSTTVWMDLNDPDPSRKFKAFAYVWNAPHGMMTYFSPDGIHWSPQSGQTYPVTALEDRTTLFWNPFRNVWVDSLKNYLTLPASGNSPAFISRVRFYAESPDLMNWTPSDFTDTFWTGPDVNDPPYVAGGMQPQLYNLDAVAYESVMVGLFSWYYPGPAYPSDDPLNLPGPALVELGVGFSRDGFNWVRPTRSSGPNGAFIPASNIPGTWNMGNTQSAGGCFLVVGNQLWFYFSGRNGPHAGTVGATGFATLRRDGFYSMDAGTAPASLTTRPVQFSGKYLFVNVSDPQGSLQIQVLNSQTGQVLASSLPLVVDSTIQQVTWDGLSDLSAFAGQPVEFQFNLTNGELYSFWVASDTSGASNGYVAANGPAFTGAIDNLGIAEYQSVSVAPASAILYGGQSQQFAATLPDGATQTIQWSINPAMGNISSAGLYTAPSTITGAQTITVTATALGGSRVGTSTITLTAGSTASFVGSDAVTQGSWKGKYGADGYTVAGDTQSLPSYDPTFFENGTSYTWVGSTSDPRERCKRRAVRGQSRPPGTAIQVLL